LISEEYDKFMPNIQSEIDKADKSSREKAENILKTMTNEYNNHISERIAYELQMAESEQKMGNLSMAERHRMMAEIFKSVLQATTKQ
jgi:predicted S18 family serine protease